MTVVLENVWYTIFIKRAELMEYFTSWKSEKVRLLSKQNICTYTQLNEYIHMHIQAL